MTKEDKIKFAQKVVELNDWLNGNVQLTGREVKRIPKAITKLLECLFYEETINNIEIGISDKAAEFGATFHKHTIGNNSNYRLKPKGTEWEHYIPMENCIQQILKGDFSCLDNFKFCIITKDEHKRLHALDKKGKLRIDEETAKYFYDKAEINITWHK